MEAPMLFNGQSTRSGGAVVLARTLQGVAKSLNATIEAEIR